MARLLYAFLAIATLTSCVKTYDIHGSSGLADLDGKMFYLRTYKNSDMKSLDSCDVVHGQFHFTGTVDSAKLVTLCMDDEGVLPVVLEGGDITIKIDDAQQRAQGTPLNDKLTGFIEKYRQLQNMLQELSHKQSQAIMNGSDMDQVNAQLAKEANEIAMKEDKLVTSFIVENFDNVLGPGVFFLITAGNEIPELSPWIEDIWSRATDKFKSDPYVKDYYQKAQQNQSIMNGTADLMQPVVPPVEPSLQGDGAPTPNELAGGK